MNILDIIIIGIIGVTVLVSYSKGFIKTLFDLVSMIITFALTYYLYPYISRFIMTKTNLQVTIAEKISKSFHLDKLLSGAVQKEDQINAINQLSLPENIKDMLASNNNPEMFKLLDVSSFQEYVSNSLATIVLNVIVFVILFIIIVIILKVLVNVLNLIALLPGLKQVNKTTGAVIGAVMGIGIVYIVMLIISLMISVNGSSKLVDMLDHSVIGTFFYSTNPLMVLLGNDGADSHFWKTIASFYKDK